MNSNKLFFGVLLIAVLCCSVFELVWNQFMPARFQMPSAFLMLGIFALFTSAFHLFLLHAAKGSAQAFVRKYMVTAVLKLLFYVFLMALFLFFAENERPAVVIHFMVFYIVFTVLELSIFLKALNTSKKE